MRQATGAPRSNRLNFPALSDRSRPDSAQHSDSSSPARTRTCRSCSSSTCRLRTPRRRRRSYRRSRSVASPRRTLQGSPHTSSACSRRSPGTPGLVSTCRTRFSFRSRCRPRRSWPARRCTGPDRADSRSRPRRRCRPTSLCRRARRRPRCRPRPRYYRSRRCRPLQRSRRWMRSPPFPRPPRTGRGRASSRRPRTPGRPQGRRQGRRKTPALPVCIRPHRNARRARPSTRPVPLLEYSFDIS